MSSIPYESPLCFAPTNQKKQQRASIGEVVGPKAEQINRKLREKRRLTQFNFEVPFVDLQEIAKTLASGGCGEGNNSMMHYDEDDGKSIQTDGAADNEEEGEEEDEDERYTRYLDGDSEIGAEDIILKWVV
ncbi:hypothetical protein HOP50_17g79340 [Chloropicon primus]|uniref:Uncharacterized protein n=1 Tax=Chloropicon primus TaxID=1764295 RepID=A0A5B8N0U1_9CHLO|nr:hypothetical protein A3770_17p79120 [Chloropicon primus]UPR04592.1 hypothetical protein HOP50_17g79340 [Chloropicon primus]|eukprot:QDZ25394.1 hypothetical protein A3770_17p79120 [Chloropicon primus]